MHNITGSINILAIPENLERQAGIPDDTAVKAPEALPEEILVLIFSYLPIQDIGHARQVCRDWNQAGGTEQVWRAVADRFEIHPWGEEPDGRSMTYQFLVRDASMRLGYFFDLRSMIEIDLGAHTIRITANLKGDFFQVQEKTRGILGSISQVGKLLPPRSYLCVESAIAPMGNKHWEFLVIGPNGLCCGSEGRGIDNFPTSEKQKYLRRLTPRGDRENLSLYREFSLIPNTTGTK